MLPKLADIAEVFQSVEPDMRLEMLLDYARKLPALPEVYQRRRDAGANRVHECITPVFLFMERDVAGNLHLYADVAEESPTVRGLLSILVESCTGEPANHVAQIPADLLQRLALHQCIGAQRTMGFAGILARIRREAAKLASPDPMATP